MSEPRWQTRFEVKPNSWVYVPTETEAEYGREIHDALLAKWTAPANYFHLQLGGHLAALHYHQNHHIFAHLDVSNFFGSISKSRITRSLKGLVSYEAARLIAKRSTVPVSNDQSHSHCLPYGFVQSPILASICIQQSYLGTLLKNLSRNPGVRVSLYMDDILISSDDADLVHHAYDDIKIAAKKSKFQLSEMKESPPGEMVICFNIELSHQHLWISAPRLRSLALDYLSATNEFQQDGIRGYINSVNPEQLAEFDLLLVTLAG